MHVHPLGGERLRLMLDMKREPRESRPGRRFGGAGL